MLDQVQDNDQAGASREVPASTPETKLRGIAICGSHPETKKKAPFDDESWLIYACSPDNSPHGINPGHCSPLPRVDAWFEIHQPVFDRTRPYAYLDWLKNIPVVYMRDQVAMNMRTRDGKPLFPTARPYPEQVVKERFGPYAFTSSIAFMMAKAILDIEAVRSRGMAVTDEPVKMGLWGILQASQNEYAYQRQGTQQMIWYATQSGIQVMASVKSFLFEPPPEIF